MGILNNIINKLRGTKASATPQVTSADAQMTELAQKLADKRGDNVTIGVAQAGGNAAERLATNADIAGIVSSSGEDDVISS